MSEEHADQPQLEDRPAYAERRPTSTIGGTCFLGILLLAVCGVAVAAFGYWRQGVYCIAASLLLAATARAFLPRREAGMLAVRSRAFDCTLLIVVGVAMIVLAMDLPDAV